MSTLISPGVSVTVTDEVQSVSAGTGTIPLIFIATATNKFATDGVSIASGTQEAGRLRLITSQRDLLQRYGNPIFEEVQGTVIQGSEISEYGLHQAYSYLGIANTAYVIRADIDLNQLSYSDTAPTSPPLNGTYWFNTTQTSFGAFRANGNSTPGLAWDAVTVKLPSDSELTGNVPAVSYGVDGDLAIATQTTSNLMYEKISGAWYNIGSPAWYQARPTVAVGTEVSPVITLPANIIINGTTVALTGSGTTTVADIVNDINGEAITDITASGTTQLTITNAAGTSIALSVSTGDALTELGLDALYAGYAFSYSPHTSVPVGTHSGDIWIKTTNPNFGASYNVQLYSVSTGQFATVAAPFYVDDTAANTGYGTAKQIGSLYVQYNTLTSTPPQANHIIKRWNGTAWVALTYVASALAPTNDPLEDTLWISNDFRVDIMVNNPLSSPEWLGYANAYANTDPDGVLIAASQPFTQSDGSALVDNDLWLDTSDLVNYPKIYRYSVSTSQWTLIDNTDQTTPFGIVFGDARPNDDGTDTGSEAASDMVASDYVDADAPDPRLYPAGTLLFNTRYSTYNVKQWKPDHFLGQGSYEVGEFDGTAPSYVARWVTASGNKTDGSPYMGRFAQHQMVVEAFNALISENDDIRSEFNFFNLMSCPGYPEVILPLISLNVDRKETAFIIADTPMRLKADGTSIQNWATNVENVDLTNEFGRTNRYTYAAQYYPQGLSVNTDGSNVVVPSSTIAMRTYAYNDSVAYPWTPPAGTQRGVVTNASSVGYIDPLTEEYVSVVLSQGQRDVLYTNDINPIAFLPNRGLLVYGDKTLSPEENAQSRVNVARLVCYLRYQLDQLAQPFLFQLNTETTRAAAQSVFERFLGDLLSLGAITDFAVDCSSSNNTPTTIAMNQLWIDVAIVPAFSINFIYIPMRLVSTIQG